MWSHGYYDPQSTIQWATQDNGYPFIWTYIMQQYGKNYQKQAHTIEVKTSQVFRETQVDQWVSRTRSTKNLLYEFQHTWGPCC